MAGEGSSHEKNFKYYIKNILGITLHLARLRRSRPRFARHLAAPRPPLPCRITLPISALRLPPGRKAPALRLKGA